MWYFHTNFGKLMNIMRFIDDTMLPKSVERKPRAQIFSLPAQALPQ
jgi:hypothetical protein